MPVDIGSIKRNDQIAGAAAILAFILALIPGARSFDAKDAVREEAEADGMATDSVNLWHGLGVLAAILLILALAGVVVSILNNLPQLEGVPVRWITTGLWGLTSLLVLIYIFTYEGQLSEGGFSIDRGEVYDMAPGIVGILLLLVCIAATVFSVLGAQESGEQLPGRGSSTTGGATPPPAA